MRGHEAEDGREASEWMAELSSGQDSRVRSPGADRQSESVDQLAGCASLLQA